MRKTCALLMAATASLLFLFSFSSVRGAQSEKPLPPGCAGVKTCECCHQDLVENLGRTEMGRLFIKHPRNTPEELVCETCHGPGKTHADSEGKEFGEMIRFAKGSTTPLEKRNEACLQCHQKRGLMFWQGSVHDMRNITCSNCHSIHGKNQKINNTKLLALNGITETCEQCHQKQIAQQMRFSHHPLREGKMNCASCHNPHGTVSESLMKGNSLNDLCFKCHAEFRGPHRWEHSPVQESCANCHSSHGSNYPRLLKLPETRLCRECHITFHSLGTSGTNTRRVAGRIAGALCTGCHINVHGSNSPNGFVFTR